MADTNETTMDKLKNLFHEEVKAKSEISGGSWDANTNTYTVKNEGTGVKTDYILKKNKFLDTGYSVKIKCTKELSDASTGISKQIEVMYDKKQEKWVPKSQSVKAIEAMQTRPKYMASLHEQKGIAGESVMNIVLEPAKFKAKSRLIFVPVR